MSVRIDEHVRRKPDGPTCCGCKEPVMPGERYRRAVAVQEDFHGHGSFYIAAHLEGAADGE